jgi:hypothetical protein
MGKRLEGHAIRPAGYPSPDAGGNVAAMDTDLGRHAAANLLLAAGGLLVTTAAAVFAVAHWSHIGPAGRAAILAAVSAAALFAPWPLTRRGLRATAESAAIVGLALTGWEVWLARLVVPAARVGLAARGMEARRVRRLGRRDRGDGSGGDPLAGGP